MQSHVAGVWCVGACGGSSTCRVAACAADLPPPQPQPRVTPHSICHPPRAPPRTWISLASIDHVHFPVRAATPTGVDAGRPGAPLQPAPEDCGLWTEQGGHALAAQEPRGHCHMWVATREAVGAGRGWPGEGGLQIPAQTKPNHAKLAEHRQRRRVQALVLYESGRGVVEKQGERRQAGTAGPEERYVVSGKS